MNQSIFSTALLAMTLLVTSCNTLVLNEDAVIVFPVAETQPVNSRDDAADDPAIWVNTRNPVNSLVLGTDKQFGLLVYDLDGKLIQSLERGRLNNVDIRLGVLNGEDVSLAVATNRTERSIDIFSISSQGMVSFELAQPVSLSDPYGICMFAEDNGEVHVFANSKDGEYQQWVLNPAGQLAPELVGGFTLNSQPEGCSVDDVTKTLYVGEEELGIWVMPADSSRAQERTLMIEVGQGQMTADVEGMEVYRQGEQGYLVASSQGDNSYAVFNLEDTRYLGSFRIADTVDGSIDGSEETDGLSLSSIPMGAAYPQGLLVVQDGYNRLPKENQNFKYVSWQSVLEGLSLAP